MVVTDVTAHHLRLPRVRGTFDGTQDVLLVRVETDRGRVGWGEVVSASAVARSVIEAPCSGGGRHGLRELVVGLDARDPPGAWRAMYEGTAWYGRRGVAVHAMAGVDVALWDLRAQVLGVPLHRALAEGMPSRRGGEAGGTRAPARHGRAGRHAGVRAYASVLWPDGPGDVEPLVTDLIASGFTAVKLGWGRFGEDAGVDRALLGAARRAAGDAVLMVDVGRRWCVAEAVEGCRLAEAHGVEWVEEPLHPDDLGGYAELARRADVAIAAGETEETLRAFSDFLDAGVRVLQPDVGRVGLTTAMELARLASTRGVVCVPHCFGTGINTAASLHWMAAVGGPWLEVPMQPHPLCRDLVPGLPRLREGRLLPPVGPGLGVEPDEDLVSRFRWSR